MRVFVCICWGFHLFSHVHILLFKLRRQCLPLRVSMPCWSSLKSVRLSTRIELKPGYSLSFWPICLASSWNLVLFNNDALRISSGVCGNSLSRNTSEEHGPVLGSASFHSILNLLLGLGQGICHSSHDVTVRALGNTHLAGAHRGQFAFARSLALTPTNSPHKRAQLPVSHQGDRYVLHYFWS